METSPGSRLEQVLADFAERYGTLSRAREQMRALSVTARSRDGVVEVTVGANGHAAGIRFVDNRFRGMAAPQLGDSVLEALTTARAEVAARAAAVMTAANLLPALPAQPVPGGEPTRSRPQGPLWGRRPSLPTPLSPELREAVMALRDSVCEP
ncbi:YbaB/EbfC family nucleoid-associated protein [Streptomyces sp. PSKA30]|uniref:YbaB/EbfC family nucleoid-associated protein n=1 Tax=Streptomyces sp. PSKA30 TaxID=2874597 RepID=UPI001CD122C3|nr:YbaB/EbfC family nucleoid-associated protein [Streptomyces sp. PSKA30]MBZ9645409.1 YbaB/EbfC family nucleoid-associated protein [Streptomyces sp. PSKA30]